MKLVIGILAATAVVVFLASCAGTKGKGAPRSLYKNKQAQEQAYRSYDEIMKFWPVPYEEFWVPTDYGESHVIVSGPEDGLPIILLPGLFADATMWYANAGALSENYRVICPDQISYGGKSRVSDKEVKKFLDYKLWFLQHLRSFGYDHVTVAGLSYGSWQCLALAQDIPESIDHVIMLDPSETFIKMDGGIAWRGIRDFAIFPSRKTHKRFFNWMGDGFSSPKSDVWLEHMLDVIECGSVGMFDIPQHRIYTKDELQNITMPILILAGGKPIVYKDPDALAQAAEIALPHARIEIIPGTGHSLHVEKPDIVNGLILNFLSED